MSIIKKNTKKKSTFYVGEYNQETEDLLQEKIAYYIAHSSEIKKERELASLKNNKPVSGAWIVRSAEGRGMETRGSVFAKRFAKQALQSIGVKSLNPRSDPKTTMEKLRYVDDLTNKLEYIWGFYLPEWFKHPKRLGEAGLDLLDENNWPVSEELIKLSAEEFYSYRACVCLAKEINEIN